MNDWIKTAREDWRDFKRRKLRAPNYRDYTERFRGRRGLEVGGPSGFFRHVVPLYPIVAGLDGANFAAKTVWEGDIDQAQGFNFSKDRRGAQFIAEATALSEIADNAYEFVISSNCLEHVANPLKALGEWKRVAQPGTPLLLVLPNKAHNFDHKRATTTFAHLEDDYRADMSEHDLTHLEEILRDHDLAMDPPAGDLASFKARSLENFVNRCLHHHVFDMALIEQMLDFLGIKLICGDEIGGDFVALAELAK